VKVTQLLMMKKIYTMTDQEENQYRALEFPLDHEGTLGVGKGIG